MHSHIRPYYRALDGLRFVVFLLVFIHNAPYDQANQAWGFIRKHVAGVGVEFFFCLSGYLITILLHEEYKLHGQIHIGAFYRRRILRIVPLYLLMVALSVGYTAYQRGVLPEVVLRAAGLLTFTDNIVTAFDEFTFLSFAFHLWTISYDMQFYLVAPFVILWLLRQTFKKQVIGLGGVLAVVFFARAVFLLSGVSATAIYVLPLTHVESLLGGVTLGLWVSRFSIKYPLSLGLVLLAFAILLPDKYTLGWHLLAFYPLVGVGVTLVFCALLRSGDVLTSNWLTRLGKISYGLYIYHVVCIYLTLGLFAKMGWNVKTGASILLLNVTALGLTLIIAAVSYQMIESPFLKRK